MVSLEPWIVWTAIGIICVIIEIFTPGFLFLSFGAGAILTGILVYIFEALPIYMQMIAFAAITAILFFNLRRLTKKIYNKNESSTNVEALIGKIGIVTKTVPSDGRGYVKIEGETWSAVSNDVKEIAEGTKVHIVNIEGNKVIVSLEKTAGEEV
ncbi:MAG: NfeD family protein [Candidatus Cloacimonetes bacterium]|nr:NfeD family protein [Candidatus Cloacimonadota bacterium]